MVDQDLGQSVCHPTVWPCDLGQASFSGTEVPQLKNEWFVRQFKVSFPCPPANIDFHNCSHDKPDKKRGGDSNPHQPALHHHTQPLKHGPRRGSSCGSSAPTLVYSNGAPMVAPRVLYTVAPAFCFQQAHRPSCDLFRLTAGPVPLLHGTLAQLCKPDLQR